ncbi:MAG: hypothetical protein AAI946_00200 [Candidatus Hodgkinia cicadicola]
MVLKLLANGAELDYAAEALCIAKCSFCVVVRCFKLARFANHSGCYLLLRAGNEFVLAYCSKFVAIRSVVLFSRYCVYVPKYLESFNARSVYGVKCNGFLVTPYDLSASSVYNRVVLSNAASASAVSVRKLNKLDAINASLLTELMCLTKRISISSSNIKLKRVELKRGLLTLSAKQLSWELLCVSASWCVYKDSLRLLQWYVSANCSLEGSVRDFFVFISRLHNAFVYIGHSHTLLRNSVLNERLLLSEGYISLANEMLISEGGSLSSVVGVLDIDCFWKKAVNSNPVFVISSNARLSLNAVKRILSVLVLDSSRLSYTRLRTLALKVKHFFINFASVGIGLHTNWNVLCRRLKLLKLIGVTAVNIGAIVFLTLPIWRLDLINFVNVMRFWDIKLNRNCYLSAKFQNGCKRRIVAYTTRHLSVLMLIRRYFSGFGFIEFKTSCLLSKQAVDLFADLSCAPVYSVNNDLFVKCSAAPELIACYSKHKFAACGVYELCKLSTSSATREAFCIIGDSQVFSHLFYSFYRTLFRSLPLIVKSAGNSWQVLDLNLEHVCLCDKLSYSVLSRYNLTKELFYFESVCKIASELLAQSATHVFNATDVIITLKPISELHNFVYKLQRYTSMLCSVRVLCCSRCLSSVLVSLRLKCFAPFPDLFCAVCLVLEDFITQNSSEILWKC